MVGLSVVLGRRERAKEPERRTKHIISARRERPTTSRDRLSCRLVLLSHLFVSEMPHFQRPELISPLASLTAPACYVTVPRRLSEAWLILQTSSTIVGTLRRFA